MHFSVQQLRSRLTVADKDGSAAAGSAEESEEVNGRALDIRGTVTNLMIALEDIVHQVGEHKRVVEVATATVTSMC